MEVCVIVGVLIVCTIVLAVLLSESGHNDDNGGPIAQAQHKLDCLEIALTGKYNDKE